MANGGLRASYFVMITYLWINLVYINVSFDRYSWDFKTLFYTHHRLNRPCVRCIADRVLYVMVLLAAGSSMIIISTSHNLPKTPVSMSPSQKSQVSVKLANKTLMSLLPNVKYHLQLSSRICYREWPTCSPKKPECG